MGDYEQYIIIVGKTFVSFYSEIIKSFESILMNCNIDFSLATMKKLASSLVDSYIYKKIETCTAFTTR